MALAHITDFVARTGARVLSQYRRLPKFMGLVDGISGQVQAAEDALWDIVAQLSVDTAEGVWLDQLGAIVGEARVGENDSVYRDLIRARIYANRSHGRLLSATRFTESSIGEQRRPQT